MKTFRFLCLASLCALILLAATASQGGTGADIAVSKPPTPVDQAGNNTPENRQNLEPSGNRSSGTITITMTGMVGDPGDLSGG